MDKILVSACLVGKNCKYNGKSNFNIDIKKLEEKYEFVLICPEVMGGLSTPRVPSEILNDKVISKEGIDVTKNFFDGAKCALDIALKNNVKFAILKDGSPSCGSNYIYDGTFTSTKIKDMGVTAKILSSNGIKIYSEKDIDLLK